MRYTLRAIHMASVQDSYKARAVHTLTRSQGIGPLHARETYSHYWDDEPGPRQPSLKYALWVAAMSPQKSLAENARAATVLARYVRHPLPRNPETLWRALHVAGAGQVYKLRIDAIYWAETCEHFGMLAS